MSSATSTKAARSSGGAGGHDATATTPTTDPGLRPWQFFMLAALACATAVTWLARAQGLTAVIMLSLLMGAVAFAALTMLRTIGPLVSPEEDRTVMLGGRTRAAFEREKLLTLRAIKELEFDHAMKKVSDEDFREMSGRLRLRAARLIHELDAAGGYRARIEQDLSKRLGEDTAPGGATASAQIAHGEGDGVRRACSACSTQNDPDARFCKACGARL
jgi:hypothetical protein